MFATSWYQLYFLITVHLCIIDCTSHNHALETETTVW